MKVINNNLDNFRNMIAPIDDSIILKIAQLSFERTKDIERYNLRDEIYKSKYIPKNLEQSEFQLEQILESQFGSNVRMENQNQEYKWVKINTQDMGKISNRFYIAPNPQNLHQLVLNLVKAFDAQNVPVRFKYQLTTGMSQCDRIIIYTDELHKHYVENAIKTVYDNYFQLFDGCERSIAWINTTSVPNVYSAPETPGEAYSNVFSDVISESKETFNFLYGITNSNSKISLHGKEAEEALEYMKLIVSSIMLRKGILKAKDGRTITFIDKNVKACYDYNTGVLTHFNQDSRGYYEVRFEQSQQGKEALLKNFYSVSKISPQNGLSVRYLTSKEKQEETYRVLYADYYKYKQNLANQVQSNGKKI